MNHAIAVFDTGDPARPFPGLACGTPFYTIGCETYTEEQMIDGVRTVFTGVRGGVMSESVAELVRARPDRQRLEGPLSIAELQKLSAEIEVELPNDQDGKLTTDTRQQTGH